MAIEPHRRAEPGPPLHLRPAAMAQVAGGATLGAAARDAIAQAWPAAHDGFPGSTLTINLSGAFLLGLLLQALVRRGDDRGSRRARLVVGTGFLGAFTTYSTFAVEGTLLAEHGHGWVASAYGAATVLGGLLATAAGITLGDRRR